MIWLWVAEGFIEQSENRNLEEIAKNYLMDLIDRSLVIVSGRRKSNGSVRACTLHDLVRELCLRKAKEEGLFLKMERGVLPSNVLKSPYKPVRMFTNQDTYFLGPSALNFRSVLFFGDFNRFSYYCSFMLLRVLDLQKCNMRDLPGGIELLVHLRYLAIDMSFEGFPSSICNLRGLLTLIYITNRNVTELPENVSDLVNLRHLLSYRPLYLRSIRKPMNLQTISSVRLGDEVGNFQKCFPYIKEFTCSKYGGDKTCDFKSLACLKKLIFHDYRRGRNLITFPETLKSLTLVNSRLSWNDMSIIQSLPNLQFLKLKTDAFLGSCWNTDGQVFRQLKFFRLECLGIQQWEASAQSFPCLRQLKIYSCKHLEETPLEIGDIPTLKLIRIKRCSESLNESVRRIEEDQNDSGNYDLNIELTV